MDDKQKQGAEARRSDSEDSSDSEPRVYAVKRTSSGWRLDRRRLFQAAAAVAGGAAASGQAQAQTCVTGSRAHTSNIAGLAIIRSDRAIVSGSYDKTIKTWSWPDGGLTKTLQVSDMVRGLAVTPDGKILIAIITAKSELQMFSLPDLTLLKSLPGHTSTPAGIAISGDGRSLASTGMDNATRVWSLPGGNLLKTFQETGTGWKERLAISPDGTIVATGGVFSTAISLWSVEQGKLLKTLTGSGSRVDSLAMHPNGRTLASCGGDGVVRLWSLPEGEQSGEVTTEVFVGRGIQFTPDGRFIVLRSISAPAILRFPELTSFKTSSVPSVSIIESMALSPDLEFLVVGTSDGLIRTYTMPDLRLIDRCLMDPVASSPDATAVTYTVGGGTFTLPCGSPIPPGAVCTCNCIQGSGCSCVSYSSGGGGGHYWYPN